MKVLLVGEGPSELGGALRTLVTRLSAAEFEIEQDRVSRRDIHAHHGKGRGYFKRAIRWMLEAQRRGFDVLILVIDQDDATERVRETGSRTHWNHHDPSRARSRDKEVRCLDAGG